MKDMGREIFPLDADRNAIAPEILAMDDGLQVQHGVDLQAYGS